MSSLYKCSFSDITTCLHETANNVFQLGNKAEGKRANWDGIPIKRLETSTQIMNITTSNEKYKCSVGKYRNMYFRNHRNRKEGTYICSKDNSYGYYEIPKMVMEFVHKLTGNKRSKQNDWNHYQKHC